MKHLLLTVPVVALLVSLASSVSCDAGGLPTVDEVLASKQDLWGIAATNAPGGPTYHFFKDLLPPLRYVNAEFRHYPIVLSAPGAPSKGRLTSNGSGVNARAVLTTWKEVGTPILFFVGENSEPFGSDLRRLTGPVYERGYLPIVHLGYRQGENIYTQQTFASTAATLADHGVILVEFGFKTGKAGRVTVKVDTTETLVLARGALQKTNGEAIVGLSNEKWTWNAETKTLTTSLRDGGSARLAVVTRPMKLDGVDLVGAGAFAKQRKACIATWEQLLRAGTWIDIPEDYVNNAWRATVCGCQMMRKGEAMNYSFGNAYDRLYQAECGDVVRGLALFGNRDVLPLQSKLLDYSRDSLRFHNAGFKLQALAHLYWLTHDTNLVTGLRPKWEKEVKMILEGREKESGLFPKERYCGDIETSVYSLNPNANCWRGLRDFAAVLDDVNEHERAGELFADAAKFRTAIWKAVEQSEDKQSQPPFIPMMLFGKEKPYEKLTDSMLGSYYNLLAPYVIGSGVFGPKAPRERWMIDYLQEHSGIALGMIRFDQHSGLFANSQGVDDLYGIRYTTKLLELDEVDRALVSFYGKLAHGLTRDTFVGAEGTSFRALDEFGRPMYLPPNSSSSALLLWTLRNLLVQDWDLNDDGKPETLRLLFATPRDWLTDGKTITVQNAPTAFGPVSLKVKSALRRGEVRIDLVAPLKMVPTKTLLRARLPIGWKIVSAQSGRQTLSVDENGAVDLTGLSRHVTVKFKVTRTR
jgi:hypothetical protein